VVCVFARKTSEPLTSLVKQIDQKIGENPSLKSFVVIMTRDFANTKQALEKLAKDAGVKHVPLTMTGEKDGPPDYDIARDADTTVLMWKEHKVKVNHGYKGELTGKEIDAIVADVPKFLSE
jgi:hypothetical protein